MIGVLGLLSLNQSRLAFHCGDNFTDRSGLRERAAASDKAITLVAAPRFGFFDDQDRGFCRMAENRESHVVRCVIDGVIAPFPRCDPAAVDIKDLAEFGAAKRYTGLPPFV